MSQEAKPRSATSRRDFVRMVLGSSAAVAAGCASPPAPPPSRVRGESHYHVPPLTGTGPIDAHVHLWSGNSVLYPRADAFADQPMKPRRYTARDFLAIASRTGVERAVLVQTALYGEDHSYLLDVLREYPQHFAGIGTVDRTQEPEARLRQLASLGLRGARLVSHTGCEAWADDERFQALFRGAADEGMVLDLLTIPEHFAAMEALCQRSPETVIVIDHLGRPRGDWREREEDLDALCRMARYPRVHLKWSGLHMLAIDAEHYDELVPVFERVLGEFGPERMMWGSDAPYQFRKGNGYKESLEWISQRAPLSEADREQILRRTAERLFFS